MAIDEKIPDKNIHFEDREYLEPLKSLIEEVRYICQRTQAIVAHSRGAIDAPRPYAPLQFKSIYNT